MEWILIMVTKLFFDYVYIYNTKNNKDPDKRYLYFYDLSDDTVFRTNDKDCLDRFMKKLPRSILPVVLFSMDKGLQMHRLLCLLPFAITILLIRMQVPNDWVVFSFYASSLITTVDFYFQIVKIKTNEMKQIKLNGNVVKISKDNNADEEGKISVEEVKNLIEEGKKQERIDSLFFYIALICLFGIIMPLCYMDVFDSSMEILPHNYVRIKTHLDKIIKGGEQEFIPENWE